MRSYGIVRMSVNEMDHDDEERLLQSNQENDHEEFRASPASKYSKTFWHSFLLFITFIASIFSFVALEHRWKHPFTIPKISSQEVCEHATARPSWHSLPLHRRHAYTRAVQRLTTIPSRLGLNTSLYDDFTYIHIQLTWQVHHVAVSLPFHRYFVHVFEQTLQDEGGYDGLMPYWDWTLDAQSPLDSPIWDSWAGFGGNGSEAADSCVEEGILGRIAKPANYSECGYKPHCVKRVFDDSKQYGMLHSKQWNKEIVKHIIEGSKTYDELREGLENGPHRHLHLGIGGEMPTASSTNGKH